MVGPAVLESPRALDDDPVRAPEEDHGIGPASSSADRAMLDYGGKLTRDATAIGPRDHERLRSHGFDDRGILQIALIVAWFNSINRVADAPGVGRS